MDTEKNLVQVDYTLFLKDKASEAIRQSNENHLMRYTFTPEMRSLLEASGFDLINTEEWVSGEPWITIPGVPVS